MDTGNYQLRIHEAGDIYYGCNNVGNTLEMGYLADLDSPAYGNENQYVYEDDTLNIFGDDSIIGSSLVLSKDGNNIACCVIGK